jgi:hypothetical protein
MNLPAFILDESIPAFILDESIPAFILDESIPAFAFILIQRFTAKRLLPSEFFVVVALLYIAIVLVNSQIVTLIPTKEVLNDLTSGVTIG